jgi:hypothetical protein
MRTVKTLACLVAFTFLSNASDVSGKWTGTAEVKLPEGETRVYSVYAEFSQNGEDVSGTIGSEPEEQIAIQQGKIQGTKFSFEVTPPESLDPVKFQLEVKESRLEGELKGRADRGPISGTVTLSRAS